MGFSLDISIPAFTVFLQGLLSFFSPCVLPLLPLYIGYLSGGTAARGEDGRMHYKRSKVMLHTVCFVVGVSFAFFLLGLGFTAAGSFFKNYHQLFAQIGGVLVLLFGLYQLGVFGSSRTLGRERRLPLKLDVLAMSPLTALLMGFTFSFAWTPCVGPALASVLLMAASAKTGAMGFLLIGVYTAGFVLPFLAVGLFTTSLLEFFRNHMNVVKYTVKAGGILMIFMGILMLTGKMNVVSGYLSGLSGSGGTNQETIAETETEEKSEAAEAVTDASEEKAEAAEAVTEESGKKAEDTEAAADAETNGPDTEAAAAEAESETERPKIPAPDFTLTDQYGETHTLSEYKGKTVFLNFWATWCPPCKAELPDIQALYEEYQEAGDDSLVILGMAAPEMGQEISQDGVEQFLEENGYTYPVLMDTTGELFRTYGAYSLPTTFMIDRDGNVFGYISGQLTKEMMESIIRQTMEGRME